MCIIGCEKQDTIQTYIGGFCSEEHREVVTHRIGLVLLGVDPDTMEPIRPKKPTS
jgi:hypothetical protein